MPDLLLTTAPGLEALALEEAHELGLRQARVTGPGTLEARCKLTAALDLHLRARLLHRALLQVGQVRARALPQLRRQVTALPWGTWIQKDSPFVVQASASASRIYHTGAIAQRVAEAITEATSARLDPDHPEAQLVQARMQGDTCTLRLDMSGQRLHMRGWRQQTGRAPLRESMAAALLRWAGWTPAEALLDPVCGSGTFLIEAATLALGLPPGGQRPFAFERWPSLDQNLWAARRALALEPAPHPTPLHIEGSDRSEKALEATRGNAQRAGVLEALSLHQRAVADTEPPPGPGLMICNPPYGARIGAGASLKPLYRDLGALLQRRPQWRAVLLTSRPDLRDAFVQAAGRPVAKELPFQHGGLKVKASLLERQG